MSGALLIAILSLLKITGLLMNKIESVPDSFTIKEMEETSENDEVITSIIAISEKSENMNKLSKHSHILTTSVDHLDEVMESEERPYWYKDALRQIAYYLRSHKFNEYDRRYNRNGDNVERTYFKHFPKPPLRSLHWEVHRYCESSFLHCVDYLRKKLKHVALKRQDDTSIVALENQWSVNSSQLAQVEEECQKMRRVDETVAEPFEGPLERYQWRATASYYMCWYTMNEVPDLKHLNDTCNNFAYCLDNTGPSNNDIRANDKEPFACAQYSFCPDPCCPNKHLSKWEFCWNDEKNPCHHENPDGQRQCAVFRMENTDFRCVCKWGYSYNEELKKCVTNVAISRIKLNSNSARTKENVKNKWKMFMTTILRIIGKQNSNGVGRTSSCLNVLNLLLLLFLINVCLLVE
ncbi:hypothetical protein ABEB36_005934 [Hypothenemus hampei]|uniref:Uncharacterized protein n=1 Tax=Hypothenemus hampei TaxID=57062 RepID=A0ABD1F003_HYPHA